MQQKQVRNPLRKKSDISLRTRALQCLARREYSRAELCAKLLPYTQVDNDFEQGVESFGAVSLDALLEDLVERGWLSDERAVNQLIRAKRNRFGLQRIIYELRQKGIAENLICEALPALKESEFDAAQRVWDKKFGMPPQDAKQKARQVRFLQSRGFSIEVILSMLSNIESDIK